MFIFLVYILNPQHIGDMISNYYYLKLIDFAGS